MYEPIYSSAPDIADQGIANPIGTILSLKLMFEESFRNPQLGTFIDNAVENALESRLTTNIYSKISQNNVNIKRVNCRKMGNTVSEQLKIILKK